MQTACIKVRLKPGSVPRVREWAAELNRRADEVLATLRAEGVVLESVFLDTDNGDCVIYYTKALNLEEARRQYSVHTTQSMPSTRSSSGRLGKRGRLSNC